MTATMAVALVEDDADLRGATTQLLSLAGYEVHPFPDGAAAADALTGDFPGIVLSDIRMPGMSGITLFRTLRDRDADLPVILITGHGDVATAVDLLKQGAWDFLTKPCDPDLLLGAVARASAARRAVIENRRLRAAAEAAQADELIGHSPAIRHLRASLPTIVEAGLDIVIEGASGTGKQLVARLLHRASTRQRHKLVVLECGVLPASAAGDLFGALGPIADAHRGTLLLNHLDAADMQLQHAFAQFAERRAVALDSRAPQAADVRIIATLTEGGRDRLLPALYHRLAAISLQLPPLAERVEDVPLLTAHFIATLAAAHRRAAPPMADAAALMARRDWPGNVRELRNAVERLVLGIGDPRAMPAAMGDTATLPDRLREFERLAILDAFAATKGDVTSAAKRLGIPRETFYYRVKRLGIDLAAARDTV